MDFMRILRSLEEFLYEVMTWLVFYPRTFFRTLFKPLETLEYSRSELHKPEDEQYQDALSAPLFLMLSLIISHLLELALHLDPFVHAPSATAKIFATDQNLIILRSLMFAVFPMLFALEQVKISGQPLTRKSLRGPFFGECYPAAIFGLAFGLGESVKRAWPDQWIFGPGLQLAATAWYMTTQVFWLRRFYSTWRKAVIATFVCFTKAVIIILAVGVAIVLA